MARVLLQHPSSQSARTRNRRLERLVECERLQCLALAAQVRYVEAQLDVPESGVPSKAWLPDAADRLEARARQLEGLGELLEREPPAPPNGGMEAPGDDVDIDELYARWHGPLAVLREEFSVRSAALGCAIAEAEQLVDPRVTLLLREHLRALERDVDRIRHKLGQ